MPSCLECFCESGFSGQHLQKLIDSIHPAFVCELDKCSSFSPGPVDNAETIGFILIDPLHYDQERSTVVPEAFRELTTRDLSTIRVKHALQQEADTTRQDLIERGTQRIPPKLRFVDEVCIATVADIRSTILDGTRLFAVYDTGLETAPAHASIFTRGDVLADRRLRKVVRNRIHEIFTRSRIKYAEFRGMLSEKAA